MPYQIPPWLARDTDPAGKYLQGIHIGAQIQQAHEAMAQQAQEAQVRSQIALQENERDFAYRQQQTQIQNAVQQQEMDMKRQQLEMVKQKNDIATQMAAKRFSAMQEFSKRVSADEDPNKVLMSLYPSLFSSATGLPALARNLKPKAVLPPKFQTYNYKGREYPYVWNPNTGAISAFKSDVEGSLTAKQKARVAQLNKDKSQLVKEWSDPVMAAYAKKKDPESYNKAMQDIKAIDDELKQIVPPENMRQTNDQSSGVQWRYTKKGGFEKVEPVATEEPSDSDEDEEY